MTESNLGKLIQMKLSKVGVRLFRNNVALGWVGKTQFFRHPGRVFIDVQPGDVLIRQARPLHAGLCEGSSDYIGYNSNGLFTAVEIKSDSGRPTDAQINFIEQVRSVGGIAVIARKLEDVDGIK